MAYAHNPCIYQIHCVATGRSYVGSAVSAKRRFLAHRKALRAGKHHSPKLQSAWSKYGEDLFYFFVAENVPEKDDLLRREQYWMDALQTAQDGYNCAPTAGSSLGRVLSAKTRRKIGEANRNPTAETRLKMREAALRVPKEVRDRIREILKNPSDDTRAKMSASAVRRGFSANAVEAMKKANTGRKKSELRKAEMRAVWVGRKHTEASKEKMRAAKLGSKHTRSDSVGTKGG